MANAERLRLARVARALSQLELAKASGVSQPNIAAFESGKRALSDDMLRRLLIAAGARPSALLPALRDRVLDATRRHGASNVRVFGSVARGADTVDSDLDLLVTLGPQATLFDLADISADIEHILGVRVDVVSEGGLTERHAEIVRDAVPL